MTSPRRRSSAQGRRPQKGEPLSHRPRWRARYRPPAFCDGRSMALYGRLKNIEGGDVQFENDPRQKSRWRRCGLQWHLRSYRQAHGRKRHRRGGGRSLQASLAAIRCPPANLTRRPPASPASFGRQGSAPTGRGSICRSWTRPDIRRNRRGVTTVDGVYVLGLPWQYTWGSGRFVGIGRDAEFLASEIKTRLGKVNQPMQLQAAV